MSSARKNKSRDILQIRPYQPAQKRQRKQKELQEKQGQSEQQEQQKRREELEDQERIEEQEQSEGQEHIQHKDQSEQQDQEEQEEKEEQHDKDGKEEQKAESPGSQCEEAAVILIQDDNADNHNEEDKKSRGSWTAAKRLVLLQKYVEHFPPEAPWGKSTEAWQKIVDSVNAVAPNDTPLRYDACRRAIDKVSEKYIEEESIQKAAIEALSLRKYNEKTAKKLIKQESNKERKRMKKSIIQKLANERLATANQNTFLFQDSSSSSSSSSNQPPADSATATTNTSESVSYIYFDEAYVKEQREFQQTVLKYLETMNQHLKVISKAMKRD
ncbi:hypothetical protein [Parasitella parasitica]|uniref:Uncharacterized protein n=1 Tax=Parasitella parasitica TaxID=35722 RepID=A0A0B7MZ38_9FUNG|nr:hypothetical protein [Parasitella parasitica]